MVGVARRSKGCLTCRTRRVKCDERHPTCFRCEKSSLNCGGFGKDLSKPLTFVMENSRAKRRSMKQESLRAIAFLDAENSPGDLTDKSIASTESGDVTIRLWPELNLTAFKDDIQISFTLNNLFAGDKKSAIWLSWGYGSVQQNMNSSALKALSYAYFGRQHHDSSVEYRGRQHYSQTLCYLSKAIEERRATSLEVLLAAMAASMYEMIASNRYAQTLLHADGVGKLIQLRGPEEHRGMLELHTFSSMRTLVCMKAMADRKRCFLEHEDWKTIPWSFQTGGKTMIRLVEDILCHISGLYQDFDELLTVDITPEVYQSRFEVLEKRIYLQYRTLSDWQTQWQRTYPIVCVERLSSFVESPFPTVIYYHDMEAANGLMLYNALIIMLNELEMNLLGQLNYLPIGLDNLAYKSSSFANTSSYDAAIEICRSIEYYFSPPHETAGLFFVILPLRKAKNCLPNGSVEHEWLKTTMMRLAAKSGIDLLSTGVLGAPI